MTTAAMMSDHGGDGDDSAADEGSATAQSLQRAR